MKVHPVLIPRQLCDSKIMTKDEAIKIFARNRSLTEEQAEVVLSRSLVSTGDGKFRLSWEARMKRILTVPLSEDTLYSVITDHAPPMLIIEANNYRNIPGREFANDVLRHCSVTLPQYSSVTIDGGHDIHITKAKPIASYITEFLNDKKSKL